MRRILFKAPPTGFRDWEDVFARARPLHLTTLTTGCIQLGDGQVPPVLCHALQQPRGTGASYREVSPSAYLLDAGLDSSFGGDPFGNVRGILRRLGTQRASQEAGQDLLSQLIRIGVADVEAVFFTHLHPHTTAGLRVIARPVRCVAGRSERLPEFWPFRYVADFDGIAEVEEISFEKSASMPMVGPCIDVLGDGSLWAFSTPGHTLGHLSYLVITPEAPVLVLGDLAASRRQLEEGGPASHARYPELLDASCARVRTFLRDFPQVRLSLEEDRTQIP